MKTLIFIIAAVSASAASKPNIVFLLIDDLGFNDVSWHNDGIIMPNIATLASRGTHLKIMGF